MLMIAVTTLTYWTFSQKFTSFTLSNKYVCLPYEQMDKLIISHKLSKELEVKNIILTNQVRLLEIDRDTYKKKHVKTFLYGLGAGVGLSLIGAIVIIIRHLI